MQDREKDLSMGRATAAIHRGGLAAPIYGEVSVPIFQTATFGFPNAEAGAARFTGEEPGFIYTRMGNPTVHALEEAITALEQGTSGHATATGMAAIAAVLLGLLGQGDHLLAGDCLYGPTHTVINRELPRFGIGATFVDTADPGRVAEALQPNTRLLFVETPANPTLKITDLAAMARLTRERGILLAVDNTFATPHLQRPLTLGADLVVHSLTKYLNGHSDVLGGIVIVNDLDISKKIRRFLNLFGGTMDPHQAWLILRGVCTLALRVDKAQANAQKIADFLEQHPRVEWVRYPGLSHHPGHDIAKKQMDGFGAMLCFGVKGGLAGGRMLMNHLRLFTLAVSLGGVESLVQHPASMTHAGLSREERLAEGIIDEMVRLSVGCEDAEDLIADLDRALQGIP
ncbi:MAG: aminotransferase class I/II-fold pyridoxal phosphate-dependent enzyme [Syntrophobacterales bacterium]|jgi:methionine-gamma-lyase